jgi:hypothetical protein
MSGSNGVLKPMVTIGGQEVGLLWEPPAVPEKADSQFIPISIDLEIASSENVRGDTSSERNWGPLSATVATFSVLALALILLLSLKLRAWIIHRH